MISSHFRDLEADRVFQEKLLPGQAPPAAHAATLDRLNTQIEPLLGDECRMSIGQAANRLMRDFRGCEIATRIVQRRAGALAWLLAPQIFGNRSLAEVLKSLE